MRSPIVCRVVANGTERLLMLVRLRLRLRSVAVAEIPLVAGGVGRRLGLAAEVMAAAVNRCDRGNRIHPRLSEAAHRFGHSECVTHEDVDDG